MAANVWALVLEMSFSRLVHIIEFFFLQAPLPLKISHSQENVEFSGLLKEGILK